MDPTLIGGTRREEAWDSSMAQVVLGRPEGELECDVGCLPLGTGEDRYGVVHREEETATDAVVPLLCSLYVFFSNEGQQNEVLFCSVSKKILARQGSTRGRNHSPRSSGGRKSRRRSFLGEEGEGGRRRKQEEGGSEGESEKMKEREEREKNCCFRRSPLRLPLEASECTKPVGALCLRLFSPGSTEFQPPTTGSKYEGCSSETEANEEVPKASSAAFQ